RSDRRESHARSKSPHRLRRDRIVREDAATRLTPRRRRSCLPQARSALKWHCAVRQSRHPGKARGCRLPTEMLRAPSGSGRAAFHLPKACKPCPPLPRSRDRQHRLQCRECRAAARASFLISSCRVSLTVPLKAERIGIAAKKAHFGNRCDGKSREPLIIFCKMMRYLHQIDMGACAIIKPRARNASPLKPCRAQKRGHARIAQAFGNRKGDEGSVIARFLKFTMTENERAQAVILFLDLHEG